MSTATALAHPNIALIKYWGKRDVPRNLPAVPSLSLTLSGFQTTTTVVWGARADELLLNDRAGSDTETRKVMDLLDRLDPARPPCQVISRNNFPTGAGLASSASAFAALAVAASEARGGPPLTRRDLSALARQGSGSACRSLWGGFAVWRVGTRDDGSDSVGEPLAPAEHWDVVMVIGVVSTATKAVGSTEGMERSRHTSPLYPTWVAQASDDLEEGIAAVRDRDLDRLGRAMEASTFKMHAVMQTSHPPLLYWQPGTVAALHAVWALRADGVSAWVTMDAGPQVKVLCAASDASQVAQALQPHVVDVHTLRPGGAARRIE